MSKSLGNYVGINETPEDIYGKIMSISDTLMLRYYELLTDMTVPQLEQLGKDLESGARHPMEAKRQLAWQMVSDFQCRDAADNAAAHFSRVFQQRDVPQEIDTLELDAGSHLLADLLAASGLAASKTEARRLIRQGAVSLDGEKLTEQTASIIMSEGKEVVLRCGKLQFRRLVTRK
jgi:tyrosyl-tRNA synthetase